VGHGGELMIAPPQFSSAPTLDVVIRGDLRVEFRRKLVRFGLVQYPAAPLGFQASKNLGYFEHPR
jgi:hypothetical protein